MYWRSGHVSLLKGSSNLDHTHSFLRSGNGRDRFFWYGWDKSLFFGCGGEIMTGFGVCDGGDVVGVVAVVFWWFVMVF